MAFAGKEVGIPSRLIHTADVPYARGVDIRIGIINTARELVLQTNTEAKELEKTVADGMATENGTIRFEDEKGHIFVVASRHLAYVELGAEKARKVGFAP
jgi:hypothetical protein